MMDLNNQRRRQLIKYIGTGGMVLLVVGVASYLLMQHSSKKTNTTQNQVPNFVTLQDSQFTGQETKSALEEQQTQNSSQQNEINSLEKMVTNLQKQLDDQNKNHQSNPTEEAELERQIQDLRASLQNAQRGRVDRVGEGGTFNPNALGGDGGGFQNVVPTIQNFSLSFNAPKAEHKSTHDYVPAATFVRAVLLGGADANASVTGQSNTTPVIFRLLDNGYEPTQQKAGFTLQKRAPLKGCSVIGATYGDISSSRAEVRLVRLSCNRADGSVLDIPVQGTVVEGLEGILGTPIMQNGQILAFAGISGFFSGVGSALQQSTTTQSISPLGSTSTVNSGQIAQSGLYGGGSTALNMLAQYYIQRAEQYHSVIEINPGTIVSVVFTEGFSLKDSINQDDSTAQINSHQAVQQNTQDSSIDEAHKIMQQVSNGQQQNVNFGQSISPGA